jgi:hypothetical protein
MMKKLVFLSTLMAFLMPSAFAVAGSGGDGNRLSMKQAWEAVQADQKKQAAAEKATAEQLQAAFTSSKAKGRR